MKIGNQSYKWSHILDRIGVRRIRTFLFLLILTTTPSLMIQWKLDWRSGCRNDRTNQSKASQMNIVIGLFFCFCFWLQQFSFHWIVSNRAISGCIILLWTQSVWLNSILSLYVSDYNSDYDPITCKNQPSALQAATILVAMASEKKNWRPKFWRKSPIGDQQIKRETYLKNYQ